MPAEAKKDPAKMSSINGPDLILLFTAFLLPPFAFFLNLQLSYLAVPWACATGHEILLHLISAGTLLLAASNGFIAWREWKKGGRAWPDESAGREPRNRFVLVVGILMSSLFSLAILAQWIPSFVLGPCDR